MIYTNLSPRTLNFNLQVLYFIGSGPGHDLKVFVNKGHIYPESTKNGFVSLIAETENAELTVSPSEVRILSLINAVTCYTYVFDDLLYS